MKNKNLLIIGCGQRKRNGKFKAQDLYCGPYFIAKLKFAKSIKNVDKIMILSGKYGLINLDDEIEPYDHRLSLSFKFNEKELELLNKYNIYVLINQRYYKIIKNQIDIKLNIFNVYNKYPLKKYNGSYICEWLNINNGKNIEDFFDLQKLNWNMYSKEEK